MARVRGDRAGLDPRTPNAVPTQRGVGLVPVPEEPARGGTGRGPPAASSAREGRDALLLLHEQHPLLYCLYTN